MKVISKSFFEVFNMHVKGVHLFSCPPTFYPLPDIKIDTDGLGFWRKGKGSLSLTHKG
jgi:hypothetical protein